MTIYDKVLEMLNKARTPVPGKGDAVTIGVGVVDMVGVVAASIALAADEKAAGQMCPRTWVGKKVIVQLDMPMPVSDGAGIQTATGQAAAPKIGFPEISAVLLDDLPDALVLKTSGMPYGYALLKGKIHGVILDEK